MGGTPQPQGDWFSQNAPPQGGGDWFKENSPSGVPTEAEAAAHPPVAPNPKVDMQESPLAPSYREPKPLPQTEEEKQRAFYSVPRKPGETLEAGTSMAIPEALLGVGAMGLPAIVRGGIKNAVQSVAKPLVRGYLGSEGGGYIGRRIGSATQKYLGIGSPEGGEVAGSVAGGLYGGLGGKIPRLRSIIDFVTGEEIVPAAETAAARVPGPAPVERVPVPAPASPSPIPAPAAAEPRPEVVAGPAKPPSTRALIDRLGKQIEETAKYPTTEPTARAIPARATVGAKAVIDQPSDVVAGPPIKTPYRNTAEAESAARRTPGWNPLEKDVPLGEQQPAPVRPLVTEPRPANTGKYWEKFPSSKEGSPDRNVIHNIGEKLYESTSSKPDQGATRTLFHTDEPEKTRILRQALTDMDYSQVGRAAEANGIDMSNRNIGAISKTETNNVPKEQLLDEIAATGARPEQIVADGGPPDLTRVRQRAAMARQATAGPRLSYTEFLDWKRANFGPAGR